MFAIFTGCLFALALGVRHAVEPDHLAAVSSLVAEGSLAPRSARGAALLGAWWGLGHTLSLFVLGGALFALRTQVSTRLDDAFELAVAATLLFLGARAINRARTTGTRGAAHDHHHGAHHHLHSGPQAHVHVGRLTLASRPLFVGLVHGIAGSGALAALAMASMPSLGAGLWFLAWFGLGAAMGMALLAGLAGLALHRAVGSTRGHAVLVGAAGALSLVFGLVKGWPLAVRILSSGGA
jgi:hypothetical protein